MYMHLTKNVRLMQLSMVCPTPHSWGWVGGVWGFVILKGEQFPIYGAKFWYTLPDLPQRLMWGRDQAKYIYASFWGLINLAFLNESGKDPTLPNQWGTISVTIPPTFPYLSLGGRSRAYHW